MIDLLFFLLVAHALADYPLQPEFVALNKARSGPAGALFWPYCLSAHALVHGGAVAVVVACTSPAGLTVAVWLGIAEALVHAFTDHGKCEGWLGADKARSLLIDQTIHVTCKVVWAIIALAASP